MNSMTTVNEALPLAVEPRMLICWPKLSVDEQAFVTAYIENSYSLAETASALSLPTHILRKMLANSTVTKAIAEVQSELSDLDFMNDKWVKTQLLKLYPKVLGEENVPLVDNMGNQMEVKKFYPDIAMRILEYVAPKATQGKAAGNGASVNVQINLGAMGITGIDVGMQGG